MAPGRTRAPATRSATPRPPELFRKLIAVAMELERRTMQLYCRYENLFSDPDEVRAFWFDMADVTIGGAIPAPARHSRFPGTAKSTRTSRSTSSKS